MHFRAEVGSCLGTFYGNLQGSRQADAWFEHMHGLGVHHFHAYVTQRSVRGNSAMLDAVSALSSML